MNPFRLFAGVITAVLLVATGASALPHPSCERRCQLDQTTCRDLCLDKLGARGRTQCDAMCSTGEKKCADHCIAVETKAKKK